MVRDDKTIVQTYARQKVAFTHGKGAYLYDTNGREYLDFFSGVAVTALGHGDQEWADAIADQARKIAHISNLFYNEVAGRGTEAAEGAIKFARKWGKELDPSGAKYKLVSFKGGFHGRSMGALSCTANPKYQKPFTPLLPGIDHVAVGDIEGLRAAVSDATCGVVIEPIQGEGGVNVVPDEFLHEIRRLCDQHKALLIFDEVQPDIMTLAKALANGVPIGAICVKESVGKVIHPGDHGSTFAGQPLACRAGEVVFDRISQPQFLSHVQEMGQLLRQGLTNIQSPNIKEIRGRGLIAGVQVDLARLNVADVNPLLAKARDRGVLAINAGGDVIRLLPPLIVNKDQIGRAVAVLGEVLS